MLTSRCVSSRIVEGAGTSLAALKICAMVKRISPIRVLSFVLLVTCGALCQSGRSSADLHQGNTSNSPNVQHQNMPTWRSLPDAPAQRPTQAEKFQTLIRETVPEHLNPGNQSSLIPSSEAVSTQKESSIFDRYLYPSLLQRSLRYQPSNGDSLMSRATFATSHIFVSRDASGKGTLNTSYFLGVLTSAAMHTAYRPYWARSTSDTFNNFGSTIGSDAGINLFHEFGPGILQMVKGHAPRFVSRIEERITHDRNPREIVSTPTR